MTIFILTLFDHFAILFWISQMVILMIKFHLSDSKSEEKKGIFLSNSCSLDREEGIHHFWPFRFAPLGQEIQKVINCWLEVKKSAPIPRLDQPPPDPRQSNKQYQPLIYKLRDTKEKKVNRAKKPHRVEIKHRRASVSEAMVSKKGLGKEGQYLLLQHVPDI